MIWAAVIFSLSAQPSVPGPSVSGLDKIAHFTVYAILAVLTARGLRGFVASRITATLLAIILASLYGASDEWHQSFVPGRTPQWLDLVADALGACAGAVTWYALEHRSRLRREEVP